MNDSQSGQNLDGGGSSEKQKPRLSKLHSEKTNSDKLDATPASDTGKFQHYMVGHHMIWKQYGQ